MERTLVFHRATLPDDTVLLSRPSRIAVQAVGRNSDGAIVGQNVYTLDPWQIDSYTLELGAPTGQTNYRHLELTVKRTPGFDPATETIELARDSELTVNGVSLNEDGHRTQPHLYSVPVDELTGIDLGEYRLKPLGRNSAILGLVVGKHQVDGGWVPVYDTINVPEAAA